jgi:hypothetical protein
MTMATLRPSSMEKSGFVFAKAASQNMPTVVSLLNCYFRCLSQLEDDPSKLAIDCNRRALTAFSLGDSLLELLAIAGALELAESSVSSSLLLQFLSLASPLAERAYLWLDRACKC